MPPQTWPFCVMWSKSLHFITGDNPVLISSIIQYQQSVLIISNVLTNFYFLRIFNSKYVPFLHWHYLLLIALHVMSKDVFAIICFRTLRRQAGLCDRSKTFTWKLLSLFSSTTLLLFSMNVWLNCYWICWLLLAQSFVLREKMMILYIDNFQCKEEVSNPKIKTCAIQFIGLARTSTIGRVIWVTTFIVETHWIRISFRSDLL